MMPLIGKSLNNIFVFLIMLFSELKSFSSDVCQKEVGRLFAFLGSCLAQTFAQIVSLRV